MICISVLLNLANRCSVVFSAFAADALKARIEDGKSKVLITSDGYYRKGEKEDLLSKAEELEIGLI